MLIIKHILLLCAWVPGIVICLSKTSKLFIRTCPISLLLLWSPPPLFLSNIDKKPQDCSLFHSIWIFCLVQNPGVVVRHFTVPWGIFVGTAQDQYPVTTTLEDGELWWYAHWPLLIIFCHYAVRKCPLSDTKCWYSDTEINWIIIKVVVSLNCYSSTRWVMRNSLTCTIILILSSPRTPPQCGVRRTLFSPPVWSP